MIAKYYFIFFSIAFAMLTLSCSSQNQEPKYELISNKRLVELLEASDEIQLIDIRTKGETAQGIIAGAAEFDFFDAGFLEKMGNLDRNVPLVLYCRSGKRSAKASDMLKDLGFIKIYDLEGGYSEWESEGLPVAK